MNIQERENFLPNQTSLLFSIPGNISDLVFRGKRYLSPSQRDRERQWRVELAKRHAVEYALQGPLLLELSFFLPFPHSGPKFEHLAERPHVGQPSLMHLVQWVVTAGRNTVWHSPNSIADIFAKKVYDKEPRTVIIVTPLSTF